MKIVHCYGNISWTDHTFILEIFTKKSKDTKASTEELSKCNCFPDEYVCKIRKYAMCLIQILPNGGRFYYRSRPRAVSERFMSTSCPCLWWATVGSSWLGCGWSLSLTFCDSSIRSSVSCLVVCSSFLCIVCTRLLWISKYWMEAAITLTCAARQNAELLWHPYNKIRLKIRLIGHGGGC